jgi:hypothetical protein
VVNIHLQAFPNMASADFESSDDEEDGLSSSSSSSSLFASSSALAGAMRAVPLTHYGDYDSVQTEPVQQDRGTKGLSPPFTLKVFFSFRFSSSSSSSAF